MERPKQSTPERKRTRDDSVATKEAGSQFEVSDPPNPSPESQKEIDEIKKRWKKDAEGSDDHEDAHSSDEEHQEEKPEEKSAATKTARHDSRFKKIMKPLRGGFIFFFKTVWGAVKGAAASDKNLIRSIVDPTFQPKYSPPSGGAPKKATEAHGQKDDHGAAHGSGGGHGAAHH